MNYYDVYLHDFGGQSGSQIIAANNSADALRAFVETKEGSAALEKSTGAEIRVFKRTGGVVLQNKFETSQPMTPDNDGAAVPPPPVAPQPAPSTEKPFDLASHIGAFAMGAIGAMLAGQKPAAKKKSNRKK